MEKGARGRGDGESGREGVERKREMRKTGKPAGRRGEERRGRSWDDGEAAWAADQSSPRPLLQGSNDDFTVHSLSQNLSCKKDSVKTATIAARDCVIRENYQVVSWELGVGVGVGLR